MEEQPGYQQAEQVDESEQAQHIDDRQSRDTFLPQLLEVRDNPDGEEGHREKQSSEDVCFAHAGIHGWHQILGGQADGQNADERSPVAYDELRKPVPDLADQIQARMKAHTPMKMSMNTLIVAAVFMIQSGS